MRGRKPLTPDEKMLRGNPGRRDIPQLMRLCDSEIKPPDSLSTSALAMWREMAPTLIQNRIVSASDAPVFAAYCEAVALVKRIDGLIVGIFDSNDADLKILASVQAMHSRAVKTMLSLAEQFGLTPLARQRLPIGAMKEGDDPEECNYIDQPARTA